MEESDFDPKIIKLAENYSYAISGGLSKCLWDKQDKFSDKDIDWIKAYLLFFYHHSQNLDKIDEEGNLIQDE